MSKYESWMESQLELLEDKLLNCYEQKKLLAARVERLEAALSMLIERVDFDPVRHMDGVFSALIKAKQALEDSD